MSSRAIQNLFACFSDQLKQTKQPLKNLKAIDALTHCRTRALGASYYRCMLNHTEISSCTRVAIAAVMSAPINNASIGLKSKKRACSTCRTSMLFLPCRMSTYRCGVITKRYLLEFCLKPAKKHYCNYSCSSDMAVSHLGF